VRTDAEIWCPSPPSVMNLNLNVDAGCFKDDTMRWGIVV